MFQTKIYPIHRGTLLSFEVHKHTVANRILLTNTFFCSASGAGQGSIDNRIEQAMVSFKSCKMWKSWIVKTSKCPSKVEKNKNLKLTFPVHCLSQVFTCLLLCLWTVPKLNYTILRNFWLDTVKPTLFIIAQISSIKAWVDERSPFRWSYAGFPINIWPR